MKILNLLIPLFESYSDAKRKFAREASNPADVDKALDTFKVLSQRNILKGEERDLTRWMNRGWKEFQQMVMDASTRKSNKQLKSGAKNDSIKIKETEKWLVVIPLTAKASCFYGKSTKWCTAANENNRFNRYFANGYTLVYFINKETGEKWATALRDVNELTSSTGVESFDAEDKSVDYFNVAKATGIKFAELLTLVKGHLDVVDGKRGDTVPTQAMYDDVVDKMCGRIKEMEWVLKLGLGRKIRDLASHQEHSEKWAKELIDHAKQNKVPSKEMSDLFGKLLSNMKYTLEDAHDEHVKAINLISGVLMTPTMIGGGEFAQKYEDQGYVFNEAKIRDIFKNVAFEKTLPDAAEKTFVAARDLYNELRKLVPFYKKNSIFAGEYDE